LETGISSQSTLVDSAMKYAKEFDIDKIRKVAELDIETKKNEEIKRMKDEFDKVRKDSYSREEVDKAIKSTIEQLSSKHKQEQQNLISSMLQSFALKSTEEREEIFKRMREQIKQTYPYTYLLSKDEGKDS
jgi:hypothetical protein